MPPTRCAASAAFYRMPCATILAGKFQLQLRQSAIRGSWRKVFKRNFHGCRGDKGTVILPTLDRSLCLVLAIVLCAGPELATAQSATPQTQPQDSASSTQSAAPGDSAAPPAASQNSSTAPSAQSGSTQPRVTQDTQSSQAPDSQAAQTPNSGAASNAASQKKNTQEPAGAAAAQVGTTSGGAASRPAGMAIAPAKQRQVRSLLIKVGAIAAGAVAIGAVVGLARSSPSRPPGAK